MHHSRQKTIPSSSSDDRMLADAWRDLTKPRYPKRNRYPTEKSLSNSSFSSDRKRKKSKGEPALAHHAPARTNREYRYWLRSSYGEHLHPAAYSKDTHGSLQYPNQPACTRGEPIEDVKGIGENNQTQRQDSRKDAL